MPAKCSQIRADGRNASGRVTVPLRAKTPNTRDSEGLAGRPLNPLPPLLSSSGRDARYGGSAGRQPLPVYSMPAACAQSHAFAMNAPQMNNPTRKQETPNTRKSEGIAGVFC